MYSKMHCYPKYCEDDDGGVLRPTYHITISVGRNIVKVLVVFLWQVMQFIIPM